MLSTEHYISVFLTLALVTSVGVFSFSKVRTADDFTVGGRKLSPAGVTGAIVGSFAGGTVTIGTAQMAYSLGPGAMWFTIGAGISCLLLSLFLAQPMREKKVVTVTEYLVSEYGPPVRIWVAVFTAAGMFVQASVQVMAAVPVLQGMFPVSPLAASTLTVALMILYITGGGMWGTSLVGMLKLALLSVTLFASGVYSITFFGGTGGVIQSLPAGQLETVLPRGALVDLGGAFSVIVGFASTQAFLQPLYAARDARAARLGAMYSALLIPLYGLAGVAVGLFMRAMHPDINPAFALPGFIYMHLDPWLGGVAAATLLVSLILSGGALTLGVSTVLTRDVYCRFRSKATNLELLRLNRGFIPLAGVVMLVLANVSLDSLILDWSYLSNALRGVTVFLPLLGAVFFPGRFSPRGVYRAVILGPLATLVWAIFSPVSLHPLFAGLPVALLCILAGGKTAGARHHDKIYHA